MDEFSDGRRIFLADRRPQPSAVVGLAIVVVLVLGVLALASGVLDVPVVERSARTGKCVRVEVPPGWGRYGCGRMPPVYDTVWVE